MAVRNQNMANVPAYGEQLPEGCFHFRIDKVEDDGGNLVLIYSKVQTEPFVGRQVRDRFEMDNQTALSKLKAYYKAVGYETVGDAHDPVEIQGGEFYAVVEHNVSKGVTYANIAPWSIRSMIDGPVQTLGVKA